MSSIAPPGVVDKPNPMTDTLESHEIASRKQSPTHGALEPIAIVGFSFKFPQEATSQEAFWSMLMEKKCAMTEWPKDRLNIGAFHHPDKDRIDTVSLLRELENL